MKICCLAGTVGLFLSCGIYFFSSGRGKEVVFIGFIPPNTMAITIVYVLIFFHKERTSKTLNSCSFPYHLSHTLSGRFCKVCITLFNNFVFTISVLLVIFFIDWIFVVVKFIFCYNDIY